MERIYWLSDKIVLRLDDEKDPSPVTPYICNPPPEGRSKAIEKVKVAPAIIEITNESLPSTETKANNGRVFLNNAKSLYRQDTRLQVEEKNE
ncbi:MAG: hypothetical protein ACW97P_11965 [Candidatus Hodarchaeales archaeon]|jgi:hypothetical protein